MGSVLATFVLIVLALIAFGLWMSGGVQNPKVEAINPIRIPGVIPKPRDARDTSLTVVSWNIAWGYGWGSIGTGDARPEEHFRSTLHAMAKVLERLNPDIVLLQEVDFGCSRSHHIDQAETLGRLAHLPYVACGVSWRANWVPFPFWPPENHFGEVRSGGAILSRYPIETAQIQTVPKPKTNPWWYNLFYLFRYHQKAILRTHMGSILVYNVHTEAFDSENRIEHAKQLSSELSHTLTPLTILGGDLNSVLPEASVRADYPDEPNTSHQSDPTVELIRGVAGLMDTVSGDQYTQNEHQWMTFPSHEPNRKLDYLFYGVGFELDKVHVPAKLAGELSDHLPLVARLIPLKAEVS